MCLQSVDAFAVVFAAKELLDLVDGEKCSQPFVLVFLPDEEADVAVCERSVNDLG